MKENCKKKHFKKEFTMTKEDGNFFQIVDKSHYNKLYDQKDVTSKNRNSAHQICNVNFWLKNKIPVIFHKLRGYDGHHKMQGIATSGSKIIIKPNNMEKYMAFMLVTELVFIGSMYFLNFKLKALAKNLPKDNYKYLSQESQEKQLIY